MSIPIRTLGGFAAVLLLGLSSTPAVHAGSVGLAWNPAAGAAGYRVYFGPSPSSYSSWVDVGNVTEAVVQGPPDCVDSYFAVTAYNAAGESGYSNEVSTWPRPTVTSASPGSAMQGERLTLDVRGTNLQSGATVATDDPNVFLDAPATIACDRVQIAATVEPTAQDIRPAAIGPHSVTVTNPDGQSAGATGVFDVRINPARFDVVDSPGPSQGRLDGRDTIYVSRLFGSRDGDAVYDPDLDFDGDGWVDGNDLAYLAGNLGKCWTGTTWSVNACPQALR